MEVYISYKRSRPLHDALIQVSFFFLHQADPYLSLNVQQIGCKGSQSTCQHLLIYATLRLYDVLSCTRMTASRKSWNDVTFSFIVYIHLHTNYDASSSSGPMSSHDQKSTKMAGTTQALASSGIDFTYFDFDSVQRERNSRCRICLTTIHNTRQPCTL